MKNKSQKWAFSLGVGLASVAALATPSHAATINVNDFLWNDEPPSHQPVFYDLEFFDRDGNLVGTGELSHARNPFEGIIDLCLAPWCIFDPLEFRSEDNFFRVESFSSTISGLGGAAFFRPFDEELVAGFVPCTSAGCFSSLGGTGFRDDSWSVNSRGAFSSIMTANEWSIIGSIGPVESGSGTWTATRRTPVPEPASIVGLMALGALGTGSVLKRNRH